jgi:hypothetical protein
MRDMLAWNLLGFLLDPGDGSTGLLPKANLRHGTQRHIAKTVGPMRTANLTTVLSKENGTQRR